MDHTTQLTRLVNMVNGDKQVIKRLVDKEMKNHPNQTSKWILDRVEWQLMRDRA